MADEIYVGVDLAAADKKTGLCILTWPDQLKICHVKDGEIRDHLNCEDLTAAAIDAPFGWPVAFMDALRAWDPARAEKDRATPYAGDYPTPSVRERLCYRHTDRFVRFVARDLAPEKARPGWPVGLSVSTNMIGATALRAIGLLHVAAPDLRTTADWSAAQRIVEAYPAVALNAWGVPTKREGVSYKGRKPQHFNTRRLIVDDLSRQIRATNQALADEIDDKAHALAANDDALDAFVCCLVARAWRLGKTWSLEREGDHGRSAALQRLNDNPESRSATDGMTADDLAAVAEREGWIAHPFAMLEEVVRD